MVPGLMTELVVIKPRSKWTPLNLEELWNHRELLYFMVWRDIKVRYKQTALGAAWAVIQPFFSMIVFSLFFGHLAKIPSNGVAYPVFVYCGLLPWQLFSFALTESTNSLVTNRQLITKVYFPRLLVPLTPVLAGLVDFAIAFLVLVAMMFFYGIHPSAGVLLLPVFIALTVVTALAVGLWLAALNAKYRDIRYTVPFLTQLWLFLTPIAYPASLVPEKWRLLYGLNPMAGVVEGFRWALLGNEAAPGNFFFVSVAVTFLLFIGGLYYFRQIESSIADTL
jgi:lipopolysaccharide transport system permease protein